jgi:hypothetical protein
MSLEITVFSAILFFVLTPSVLVRIPKNGSVYTVAFVHAIVFALIFHFVSGFIHGTQEGFFKKFKLSESCEKMDLTDSCQKGTSCKKVDNKIPTLKKYCLP